MLLLLLLLMILHFEGSKLCTFLHWTFRYRADNVQSTYAFLSTCSSVCLSELCICLYPHGRMYHMIKRKEETENFRWFLLSYEIKVNFFTSPPPLYIDFCPNPCPCFCFCYYFLLLKIIYCDDNLSFDEEAQNIFDHDLDLNNFHYFLGGEKHQSS